MTQDQLNDVLEEISEWPLQQRRDYIKQIREAFGDGEASRIEDGLKAFWENRNG